MTAGELENEINGATLDVVRIKCLAEMADEGGGYDEQTATVMHLIIELAERANSMFCRLAVQARKLEQPAPVVVDKAKRRKAVK